MYVARQVFTVGIKGSTPRKVRIGDPVPEAETWDHMTIQSHLNMGWIERVTGDYPVEASGPEAPEAEVPSAVKKTRTSKSKKAQETPVDHAS